MFKEYQSKKDPQRKQALRTALLVLCEEILPKQDDPRRGDYVNAEAALVADIHAVLDRDEGQAKAQARYVTDAYAGGPTTGFAHTPSPTALTAWKKQDVSAVLKGASALQSGISVSQLGPDDLDVITRYGLTHAEIVAIRAYTAANYEYINTATENNRRGGGHDRQPGEEKSLDWMKAQNKKQDSNGAAIDLDPAELEAHFAEGSLHAGVLMMALNKLEDKKGQLFRGERLTPKEFQENYVSKKVYKINTFKSNSQEEDAAAVFARGNSSTGATKTVSVMCVLDVTTAKDIKDLSLYAREAEWLLMPGATFTVGTPIKEPLDKYGDPPPGAPPATECYTVHLKQTK